MAALFSLFPLLLLQLSLFLISSAYTPPDKYFINCGSDSSVKFGLNRVFVGDVKSGSLPINTGKSRTVKDDAISKSIPEIYHTARVYQQPTWYAFENINQNGTYVVRLHFFPLSSENFPDLPKARFNVWASSGYQLLSNFSLQDSKKSPVVKEFIFEVKEGPFGFQFSPSTQSSLTFVNAIEFFLAPEGFKTDSAFPVSPEVGTKNNTSYPLVSEAFQATYRINVGGFLVTPDNDTLWRIWLPDDSFLAFQAPAKISNYTGEIKYKNVTTEYTAPTFVFSSAKEINMDSNEPSNFPNLTWVFKVSKKTKYFVTLHWCDFMDRDPTFFFDFLIGSNTTSLDSTRIHSEFATPFRLEMVIISDNSGFLNIGIGISPNDDSPNPRAFLNGIEIMELIEKSLSGPILKLEEKKQTHYLLIVLLVAGVVLTALMIGLLLFYLKLRKSRNSRRRMYQEFLSQAKQSEKISITDLAPNLNLGLKIPFAEIHDATDNFHEDKVIGFGGFGNVYHATIRGKEVAIKRSRPGFGQGLNEFRTEIIILSQIRFRHLVEFYGYCDEDEEMILVYEFIERGTLRQYLYGSKSDSSPLLSWKQRLEICIQAAKGLDYLHTAGSAGGVIIHRDIKTTNILLDKDFNAKVADFGISKSGIPDPKEIDTTIRGTHGYLDPEYFNTGQLTEKSDVYSFGVLLFEVLAARPPIVQTLPTDEINLAEWSVLCKRNGEVEKLIDPRLVGTIIEPNSLRKFVEIAEKCVNEVGAERPSMRDVVYDLELALQYQYTPPDSGKAFDDSTIIGAQWDIPSTFLDRIPSTGLEDSTIIDNDSTTMNARELAAQFKIDCAR